MVKIRYDRKETVERPRDTSSMVVSAQEVSDFYEKLNKCETKAALLTLIDPFAEQFVSKSRNVPVLTDLFESCNLDLKYTELLQKCLFTFQREKLKLLSRTPGAKQRVQDSLDIVLVESEPLSVVLFTILI